jgi:hypothetical protein
MASCCENEERHVESATYNCFLPLLCCSHALVAAFNCFMAAEV